VSSHRALPARRAPRKPSTFVARCTATGAAGWARPLPQRMQHRAGQGRDPDPDRDCSFPPCLHLCKGQTVGLEAMAASLFEVDEERMELLQRTFREGHDALRIPFR
jgi:hypothetical protein